MSKQIVVDDRVYNKLSSLKETYKAKGLGKIIDRCIDTYIDTYKNPKQKMIDELGTIIDKYHYLFNSQEKEYLALFISLIRAEGLKRVSIAEGLLHRIEEDTHKQHQLRDI
jgi:hypothetical protein